MALKPDKRAIAATLAALLLLTISAQAQAVVVPLPDDPTQALVFSPSELVDKRSPAEVRQQVANEAFQRRIVPMRPNGSCPRRSVVEPTYKTYCLQKMEDKPRK